MKWKAFWHKYNQVILGGFLFALIVLAALLAPLITTYDPTSYNMRATLLPPSLEHLCGTDNFGRDVFSRIVYGSRVSLLISLSVLVVTGIVGTILGLLCGYYAWAEKIIMRIMDGLMAFPQVLLALVIVAVRGAGMENVILALSVTQIPRVVRTVRTTVISVKELEYVEGARAMGASDFRIIFKYILPNCISPLIIRLTLIMATSILSESSLTFLGVGISPEIPSWGNSLSGAKMYFTTHPYLITFPGLAIVITVLALNILGDGLRDVLDPRLN